MAHFLFTLAYGIGAAILGIALFLAVGSFFSWIWKHTGDLFNDTANWER